MDKNKNLDTIASTSEVTIPEQDLNEDVIGEIFAAYLLNTTYKVNPSDQILDFLARHAGYTKKIIRLHYAEMKKEYKNETSPFIKLQ